mgnify:FL=1
MNNKRLSDIEIEIMNYAAGGMTGYANGGGVGSMMKPKKKSYKDQSLTKAEQKKTKPVNQGGGPNYLGKQEEVTTPKKWLSSPDHVVAELAYITPREQKILLDANIYGSLKGKPNKGPNGIMSLQGDLGGFSSGSGNKGGSTGGSTGGSSGGNDYKARDYYKMMTGTGTTAKSATGDTYRSKNIAKGAVPEFVNTPTGTKYVGSKFKSYGQPTFFGDLFSGGASGYRGTQGTGTGPFGTRFFAGSPINLRGTRLKNGQILGGEYFSENEDVGDIKQSIGERISNMGILGAVKSLFKKGPKDMTEFNKLGLDGVNPASLDFDPNAQINNINTTVPDNSLALESFYNNQKPPAKITGDVDGITNYEFDQEDGITNYGFDPEMTMQEYLTDQASFQQPQPAATGVMKPGGYPVNSGSIPFNPGMGSAPIGLQYPGREPNFEQDMMEQDAGMYSGLPNQKAVNAAAMEVMSNAYKENYPYTQDDFVPGSPFDNPTSIYEAPYGLTNPNVNELTGENYFFNDGNNLASLTNNELPANDQFAEVTQMDLDRRNQFGALDYDTAKDIGMISPNLTQEEFEGIKSGAITAVG